MNHLLRLFIVSGLVGFAILVTAFELIRHGVDLLTPTHVAFFAAGMAFYLLPTALALYRKCEKAVWIAVVNVFLGWTIFGWVISLGCATTGKIKMLCPVASAPPSQPLPRHG